MASPAEQPSTATPASNRSQREDSRPSSGHNARPESPVEMKNLPSSSTEPTAHAAPLLPETVPNSSSAQESTSAQPQTVNTQPAQSTQSPSDTTAPPNTTNVTTTPPAQLNRQETEAIGPSTDTPAAKPDNSNGPVVIITLLLTNGARHPYKIDEKYLKKRNVTVEANDPYNISVYTLKELIWRDWREEWEPRPTSPSSIRLIHFGRMLDDKSPLKECRFQIEAPNVVHMTVKPQEVVDEEDAGKGKGGGRRDDGEEQTHGCRCVIL